MSFAQQIDLLNHLQAGNSNMQQQPQPHDLSIAPGVDSVNQQPASCSTSQPQPQAERANSELLLLPDWLQAELDGINVPGVTTNATTANTAAPQPQDASVCPMTPRALFASPAFSFERLGGALPPSSATSNGGNAAFESAATHGNGQQIAASTASRLGTGSYASWHDPSSSQVGGSCVQFTAAALGISA
jgi:hypothetical protein